MSWWQVALLVVLILAVAAWQLSSSLETLRGIFRTRQRLVKAVTTDRARVQRAYESAMANYRNNGALSLEDEAEFAALLPLAETCFSKEFCDSYRALKGSFAEARQVGTTAETRRRIVELKRELDTGFEREMR